MPSIHRVFLSLAAVALAAVVASAQTPGAQAPQPKAPAPAEQPKAQAPTSVQGDLVRVDPEAKTITIQPAQGADQEFKYTDDTKVVGGDKGVAGLATMKGSRVTVTFKSEGKDRVATQIEIHPRSGH